MRIKTSEDIHSSLFGANFHRYYKKSKWYKSGIRTLNELEKEKVNEHRTVTPVDDQVIISRMPSKFSSRT